MNKFCGITILSEVVFCKELHRVIETFNVEISESLLDDLVAVGLTNGHASTLN